MISIPKILLTRDEAYDAMVDYLDRYYFAVLANNPTSPGDLGSLFGCMMLLADERPVDPALWEDWNESIDKILNKRSQNEHLRNTKLQN